MQVEVESRLAAYTTDMTSDSSCQLAKFDKDLLSENAGGPEVHSMSYSSMRQELDGMMHGVGVTQCSSSCSPMQPVPVCFNFHGTQLIVTLHKSTV